MDPTPTPVVLPYAAEQLRRVGAAMTAPVPPLTPEQIDRLSENVRRTLVYISRAADRFASTVRLILRFTVAYANDPVRVAGLEGTALVRAGLDPTYATPEALDQLVSSILSGHDLDGHQSLLTPANRAVVAVAAVNGWVRHRATEDAPLYAWHRIIGGTTLSVGSAS